MYFAQLDFDLMLDKETLRQIVFGILEHCLIFVAEGCIFEVGTVLPNRSTIIVGCNEYLIHGDPKQLAQREQVNPKGL